VGLSSPRLVSVVVPSRDRPELLREALASIRAVEGPDLKFEILVGDNGDGDGAASVASEFGARYLRVDRKGAGAARNVGLFAATGEFVAFLDDDDVWLPAHVRGQLELLERRPELGAALGQVQSTDAKLEPFGFPWPWDLPSDGNLFLSMVSGFFPQIGATVARTSVRSDIGGFDETLLGDQDWDWHIRLARRNRIGFVAKPCVLFRQRSPGSYDQLQVSRLPFTRRVFRRYAISAFRAGGARALVRAYSGSHRPYYNYYAEAALARARRGETEAALAAIAKALSLSPVRGLLDLVRPTVLRSSLGAVLRPLRP
jgi:glycosyltransferase involved in cell wall biosynthesis